MFRVIEYFAKSRKVPQGHSKWCHSKAWYCLLCSFQSNYGSIYRPISNLSLISKIIERVVKSRLSDHLTSNKLINPHQSAYCKHHSTETALLYIHDNLINAIGSRKISCLSAFLIYRPPLIPLTIISYSLVYLLGLAFMALH